MYNLLVLASGFTVACMITINGTLTSNVGLFNATAIVHIVGTLFALFLCFAKGNRPHFVRNQPWWIFTGGAIGICNVLCPNFAFGKISLTSIVALGLLGQTISSIIIDNYGLMGMPKHPINKWSLIGFVFALGGIYVMLDSSVIGAVLSVLLCILAGVTIVVSRTINARLSEAAGYLQASFINHLVGLPIALCIAILTFDPSTIQTRMVITHPYMLCGGMIGAVLVVMCSVCVPKVPAFRLTLLTFLGQLATSIVIDLLMGQSLNDTSFIGGILIAIGVVANMVLDYLLCNKGKISKGKPLS